MHTSIRSILVSLTFLSIASVTLCQARGQDDGTVDFVRDIQPILEKRCMRCHAPPEPKDGLDFSLPSDVIDSYIFAEDPEGSDFYTRMVTDDPDLMMPPPGDGGPMPREEALLVKLWIMEGADWPEDVELLSPQAGGGGDPNGGIAPVAGSRIDFVADVKPILEAKCVECHGSVNPKEDIDISTREKTIGSYVLAGEPQSSSLYTRLVTEDHGKLMPPPDAGGPLLSAESLVIRLWIEEGAVWPEGETLGEIVEETPPQKSFIGKAWTFQGYFHPATVHFPVALISIAAVFVVLNWIFGGSFRDAAFYCLLFGSASAVVATVMGWALSPTQGFGNNAFDMNESAFWHRWCGVAVSVLSIGVSILAIRAKRIEKRRRLERAGKNLVWQVGVLLLAALVGLTGHQGGELSYGESWYENAFSQFSSGEEEETDASDPSSDDATNDDATNDGNETSDASSSGDDDTTEGDDTNSNSGDSVESSETPPNDQPPPPDGDDNGPDGSSN